MSQLNTLGGAFRARGEQDHGGGIGGQLLAGRLQAQTMLQIGGKFLGAGEAGAQILQIDEFDAGIGQGGHLQLGNLQKGA